MSFAKVHSGQIFLLSGRIVDVEVDLSRGLHSFSVIGLPDKAVEESRDRISAAIKNSGFESPKHKNQKVVISLAPAHLRKEGSFFDLAMALGYLLASGDIAFDPRNKLFLGELSLDGELRGAAGVLPIVIEARKMGFKEIFLPKYYVAEAALVEGVVIHGAENLTEIIELLDKDRKNKVTKIIKKIIPIHEKIESRGSVQYAEKKDSKKDQTNLDEIKGQELAKRGLTIAAAGGHNVLMYGPPGTGKTMLAKAFHNLLPKLNPEQILEVTSIHSIAGCLSGNVISDPPFRSPHHSSSHISLIGGGNIPRPGEITLAHRGVLFLDEFPEFDRRVIEALRQPLEERSITISRARGSANFPAGIIFIATMNPCPCGHFGNDSRRCVCTAKDIGRYRKKISGPIADRIDLWIQVGPIEYEKLLVSSSKQTNNNTNHSTKNHDENFSDHETLKLKQDIKRARAIQTERFKKIIDNKIVSLGSPEKVESGEKNFKVNHYETNSDIYGKDLPIFAPLSKSVEFVLVSAAKSMRLSVRSYHRVWKLARTIADLAGKFEIDETHILEALQYRPPKEPDEIRINE